MSDSITILRPLITAAALLPNPAKMNAPFAISVTVIEQSVVLGPELWYAGERYSGEA